MGGFGGETRFERPGFLMSCGGGSGGGGATEGNAGPGGQGGVGYFGGAPSPNGQDGAPGFVVFFDLDLFEGVYHYAKGTSGTGRVARSLSQAQGKREDRYCGSSSTVTSKGLPSSSGGTRNVRNPR